MKRLTGIFLLLLFLFQVGGYFAVFLAQHSRIQAQMDLQKQKLPDDRLRCIVLSADGYDAGGEKVYWEHSQEFSLRGEWYDVVRSSPGADSVTYYCVPDDLEKALWDALEAELNDDATEEKDHPSKKKPGSEELYCLTSFLFQSGTSVMNRAALPAYSAVVYPAHVRIFSPPPQAG